MRSQPSELHRSSGVRARAKTKDDYPKHEQTLVDIGKTIAAYWEPLKAQSLVSLGIPTMQVLLGLSVAFAIILPITQYAQESRRKTTKLKIFEKMAAPKGKLLYQIIKDASGKTRETTAKNINPAFKEATGEAVEPNELIDMLKKLENHGIIKTDLINIQDQPRLIWKP